MLSLDQWLKLRNEQIGAAIEAVRANPHNAEAAAEAIRAAVAFQTEEAFVPLAKLVATSLPDNRDIQVLLASAYGVFGQNAEAEAAWRAALALGDEPDVREALAFNLLVQNRPDEAMPWAEHILADKRADGVALLAATVEAYQAQGRHADALRLLDRIAAAFPQVEQDKAFKKQRKLSLKNQHTNRPIAAPRLSVSAGARPMSRWRRRIAKWALPALAMVALAIYLAVGLAQGFSRQVVLVNGTAQPYEATIGGQRFHLAPMTHRWVDLAEGEYPVAIVDRPLVATQTISIRTPLWKRPFMSRTFVVNPDAAALLVTEYARYTRDANASSGDDDEAYRLHVGQRCYAFADIDYPFEHFPDSLRLERSGGEVKRQRVFQVTGLSATAEAGVLLRDGDAAAAAQCLKNRICAEPASGQHVMLLLGVMQPAEAIAALRPGLAQRPVLVEWHRGYQEAMERSQPAYDLEAEYRRLVEAEPDDPTLVYLLGRVTSDRRRAAELFQKAATGDRPVPYAFHALAHGALVQADFAAAADFARKAQAVAADPEPFEPYEDEACVALGRWDRVLEHLRRDRARRPKDIDLVAREVQVLACKGEIAAAKQVISSFSARGQSRADVEAYERYLGSVLSYATGDEATWSRQIAELPQAGFAFELALAANRLDDADKALTDARNADWHLLLYIAAEQAQRTDLSKRHLDAAVAILRRGDRERRQAAAWLAGEQPMDAQAATQLAVVPEGKRVLLAALGIRYPEHRQACFAEARKHNYQPQFPRLFLKRVLGQ